MICIGYKNLVYEIICLWLSKQDKEVRDNKGRRRIKMFNIPYKTSSGSSCIPIESWLLSEGKVFLQDEINENSACEFVQKLMFLDKERPDGLIRIYVNSRGGEVNA